MVERNIEVFYVVRLRNGEYLKKVHTNGTSINAKHATEALRFSTQEEAEGYVSQYLRRDASCLGIVKVTVELENVRESCIG